MDDCKSYALLTVTVAQAEISEDTILNSDIPLRVAYI